MIEMFSVCNMPKIANIQIHKYKGKYYLNLIAREEVAESIGLKAGLWTESEALLSEQFNQLMTVLKKIKYEEETDD